MSVAIISKNKKRNGRIEEIRSFLKTKRKKIIQEKCQIDTSGGRQLVEFIYRRVGNTSLTFYFNPLSDLIPPVL
jgi:hypothetical protein